MRRKIKPLKPLQRIKVVARPTDNDDDLASGQKQVWRIFCESRQLAGQLEAALKDCGEVQTCYAPWLDFIPNPLYAHDEASSAELRVWVEEWKP